MPFSLFGGDDVKKKEKENVHQPKTEYGQEKGFSRQTIIVDEDYLDFIRSKPCLVEYAGCRGPIDPDHLIARGTGEHKRNDYTCLPLCRLHHSERGQIGNEKFEEKYQVRLWAVMSFLLMEYLSMKLFYQQSMKNTLELTAQVRKVQAEYFKSKKDSAILIESKKLETALDMRLGELGFKAK